METKFLGRRGQYRIGVEWWDTVFKFSCKDIQRDWIAVEVREKGFHVFSSDWLGEVQIRVKDYSDGRVHQKWFRLGRGAWKTHTRRPKGSIYLAFQLMDNKYGHPFSSKPVEVPQTYQEWQNSLENKRILNHIHPEQKREGHSRKSHSQRKGTNKESKDNNEKNHSNSTKNRSKESNEGSEKKHTKHSQRKGTNKESSDNSKKIEAKSTQAVICENLIEFSPIVVKSDRASFSSNNPFLLRTTIENTKNPFEIDFKNPFGKINGQEMPLPPVKAF